MRLRDNLARRTLGLENRAILREWGNNTGASLTHVSARRFYLPLVAVFADVHRDIGVHARLET